MSETEKRESYARAPYARAFQAIAAFKAMSIEERREIMREAGTLGDDDKPTKYVGGTSELSKDYVPLPGEIEAENGNGGGK